MATTREELDAALANAASKIAEAETLEEAQGWTGILNQTNVAIEKLNAEEANDSLNLDE
jgi:hypothetical protein